MNIGDYSKRCIMRFIMWLHGPSCSTEVLSDTSDDVAEVPEVWTEKPPRPRTSEVLCSTIRPTCSDEVFAFFLISRKSEARNRLTGCDA